jgi:flagellar operon protein
VSGTGVNGLGPSPGLPPGVAPAARPAARPSGAAVGERGFAGALDRAGQLSFSAHATKRIEQRGLTLDASRMQRLEDAVARAASKGSRDSLILLDELALVVSVRSNTVITAMDEASRKEHVFTNIDSVVIAP